MDQGWKSVLHDYVNTRNQMEIDYSLDYILPQLSDDLYAKMQVKRLNFLKEWHKARKISPKKNETRIRILQVEENDQDVTVDIALKTKFFYDLRQREHQEERIERERIIFSRNSENWVITKIEARQQEKWSSPQSNHAIKRNIKSIPFMNQNIFSGITSSPRRIRYDRSKAQQYADTWWDHPNPEYIHFDVDCTNFISQCLYAGNAPMNYTGKRENGWWYRSQNNQENWSFSWSVSHSLQWYLASSKSGLRAELVSSADQLKIGDVIIYDWDNDSKYQHSAIVAAMDAAGMPLVNAHTSNSRHRYWDYRDSYAWSEATKYRFFHISDTF